MSTLDLRERQRDSLPSITRLDLDKFRLEHSDQPRLSAMTNLSVSIAPMGSPNTIYSGPPPPYSSAASATGSIHGLPGYISPPESSSRRSTRDDKDSLPTGQSLPSISEALKNTDMSSPAYPSTQAYTSGSPPGSAVASSFSEAPKGPGNPFSQPSVPPSTSGLSASSNIVLSDPPPTISEARQLHAYAPASSPRIREPIPLPTPHALPPVVPSADRPVFHSPFESKPQHQPPSLTEHHTSPRSVTRPSLGGYPYDKSNRFQDPRNSFIKEPRSVPYNETVKRHLDIFDAELALNEVAESSARTLDFSKQWIERYHQSNRTSHFAEGLPSVAEVEDMVRHSHRTLDSLSKMREMVIMQQTAMEEQRARAMHQGRHSEDIYNNGDDPFGSGSLPGIDSKKRRGKAAPPGRCHSCNRAETPEWRRGPDGARTLCNACGLHYAKLTRKMGADKAAASTGSNLRPKDPHETRP